jgi:hypothetical protein
MSIGNPITLTSNVASKVISVTATASQTLFTVTGGYRINAIAVFRNGVRLTDSTDYTARDGASVTLLTPATEGDTLEFQIFDDFRVADAINAYDSNQTINGNLTVTGTLTGITSIVGGSIGIQSAGSPVGSATTLNFIGAGNTFAVNGNTIDISIAGGGGGGLGTAISYDDGKSTPFSYIDREAVVDQDITLDTANAGESSTIIVSVIPNITIASGVGLTVGLGKTMVIDVLQIGDL